MSRFFDAASGLPLRVEGRRALEAALDHGWADPARLHRDGRVARQLLDAARASVAASIGALPQEITFTASGTAAVQAGVLGLARGRRKVGSGVVASSVEHSSVLRAADWVVTDGEPVLVPVNPQGQVEVKAFRRAVRAEGVALACLQHVNHEVGTVQPLADVHEVTTAAGVPAPGRCRELARVAPRAGGLGRPGRQCPQVGRAGGRGFPGRPLGGPLAQSVADGRGWPAARLPRCARDRGRGDRAGGRHRRPGPTPRPIAPDS